MDVHPSKRKSGGSSDGCASKLTPRMVRWMFARRSERLVAHWMVRTSERTSTLVDRRVRASIFQRPPSILKPSATIVQRRASIVQRRALRRGERTHDVSERDPLGSPQFSEARRTAVGSPGSTGGHARFRRLRASRIRRLHSGRPSSCNPKAEPRKLGHCPAIRRRGVRSPRSSQRKLRYRRQRSNRHSQRALAGQPRRRSGHREERFGGHAKIRVTIGRLEVRAIPPADQQQRPRTGRQPVATAVPGRVPRPAQRESAFER